jgi:GTP-binding protein YchF
VKGASQGEGLGNQFLANIRETDAIVHVVRCFDDDDVLHVMGSVDPVRDREVIEFELALADLATVGEAASTARAARPRPATRTRRRGGVLERAHEFLKEGAGCGRRSSRRAAGGAAAAVAAHAKPILYAANVTDAELTGTRARTSACCARGRGERRAGAGGAVLGEDRERARRAAAEDRADFLASLGLESAGLDRLIRAGYDLLGLQTYFTAGEQEVRAWTIHRGDTAPKAAAVIHTDFERGFIKADTVGYDDFVAGGGWKGAREKGVVRSEGKEYVVQDGDVMLFKFNV